MAQLLPFYVNGTLSAEQHAEVEAALAADAALRAELEEVREIAALVQAGGAGLAVEADADAAAPDRLKALLARIDAEDTSAASGQVLAFRPRAKAPAPTRPVAAFWRPAFAAAAVLAVAQAGFITYQSQAPRNT